MYRNAQLAHSTGSVKIKPIGTPDPIGDVQNGIEAMVSDAPTGGVDNHTPSGDNVLYMGFYSTPHCSHLYRAVGQRDDDMHRTAEYIVAQS